jgi:hypothetical protein
MNLNQMISNFLRAFIEGLGGRTIALVFASILSTFFAAGAQKWLGISPEQLSTVLLALVLPAVLAILKLWHLDVATDGKTTTHALMLDRAAKTIAALAPDGTVVDRLAKAVDAAIPDTAGGTPVKLDKPTPPSAP